MKKIILFMLACTLPLTAQARQPQENCELIAQQAVVYMQQRQAGKKRQAMTFSTQGIWPQRLKNLHREIVRDAHSAKLIKDPQLMQLVLNSFQQKWYQACLDRRPDDFLFKMRTTPEN